MAEEVQKLGECPLLILSGRDDGDAIQVELKTEPGRHVYLPGDHHLGRDYPAIVGLIEAAVKPRAK